MLAAHKHRKYFSNNYYGLGCVESTPVDYFISNTKLMN